MRFGNIICDKLKNVDMIRKDFERLADKMCDIMHISRDELLTSGHYPMPYARAIIADALHQLGYLYIDIAKMVGRNHSTLVFMKQKMYDVKGLSQYKLVNKIYEEFYGRD